MSDIFQHLSQQVLSPKTAIQPLRISHFTLFSENNLSLPNLTAPSVPPVRAAKEAELRKRARTLPDPLVADELNTQNLALPSLRGIGQMVLSDHRAAAQPWPLTTVNGDGEPGINEITAETLAPEMTPGDPSSTPAMQLPSDKSAPQSSPAPTVLQESITSLSTDGRNGSSLPTFRSSSSHIEPEKSFERAEFAFSNATGAALENASSANTKDPLNSAQTSQGQSAQEGQPITHRSIEIPSADTLAANSVKPIELRTQEEDVLSPTAQNRQPSFSPVQPEANRTEVEPGKDWFEHSQETFVAETASSSERRNPDRKEESFIAAPALRDEPTRIPPAVRPLTGAEDYTASRLTPAHAPTEWPDRPGPTTATRANAEVLPGASVEAGHEEHAVTLSLSPAQASRQEQALPSLVRPASEPVSSINVQPRHFIEHTAEVEAKSVGAVTPTLPPSALASNIVSQATEHHASAYQTQPFAPSEPVSPAPLGTVDMPSVQPIQASPNAPSMIQRAALDSPSAKSVAQESTASGSAANALSVGTAENTGEIAPQLQPLPQPKAPADIEQAPAAEENVAVTDSIGEAVLQRKPNMAVPATMPQPMPTASSSVPLVTPAYPTAAAVPITSPIAVSELSPVAVTLPGDAYAAAPVEPLLPPSKPTQRREKQERAREEEIATPERAPMAITESATFEATPRLYPTSDLTVTASSVQPVTPTMAEQPSTAPRPAALEQTLATTNHGVPTQLVPIVRPIPTADQPPSAQAALSHSDAKAPTFDVAAPSERGHPASTVESVRATSAALSQPAAHPMANEAPLAPSEHGEVLPLRQAPIVSVPPISEQMEVHVQQSAEDISVPLNRSTMVQQTRMAQIHPASTVTSQTVTGSTPSREPAHLEAARLQPLPEQNIRTLTTGVLSNLQQEPNKESAPEPTPSSLVPAKKLKTASVAPSVATQLTVQNDAKVGAIGQPFTQTSIMPAPLQTEIPAHEARSGPSHRTAEALDNTVFALTNHAAPEPLQERTIVPALPVSTSMVAERGTIVPATTLLAENQHPEKLAMRGSQPADKFHSAPLAQENAASVQPQTRSFVPMRKAPAVSTPEPIPTIHVTIGRVFVHTAAEPAKPAGPSHRVAQPPLSLDAYLQQRQQEVR